jgi:hypothetical protein
VNQVDREEEVVISSRVRWLERLIIAGLAVAMLAYAILPWVWAERSHRLEHNPGMVFTGALHSYADDATTYWSWMRQAQEGRFFMTDQFTPDAHPRNYVNIFFFGLGQLAAITGLDVILVYNLSRVVLGFVLMLMLYLLAIRLFKRPGERIACFFLMAVTSGWEGVAGYLERNHGWEHVTSPGWWTPEMSTFYSIMVFPHFVAGFIAMVATVILLLAPWTDPAMPDRRRHLQAAAAGGVMFVLTFFHPYDVVNLLGLVWLAPVLLGAMQRRLPWREAKVSAVATAVWLPAFLYNLYVFRNNPAMRAWDEQNIMITPDWDRLIISLGMTGLLSAVALMGMKWLSSRQVVMAAWLLSTLILIHLPLSQVRFQRRMLGGIQFTTGALAVAAIAVVLIPLIRRLMARRTAAGAFGWAVLIPVIVLMPIQIATPYYLEDLERSRLQLVNYPSWLMDEEVAALKRLDALEPAEAVVMASYKMGNFIPPYAGKRCVIGHYALTINAREKEAAALRFFSAGPEDDAWRREFLALWDARYLVHSRYERELGEFDPAQVPWLELLFSEGDDPERQVSVYAVRLAAAEAARAPSSIPSP